MSSEQIVNVEQAEAWNGSEGEFWAAHQARFDSMISPHHAQLMAAVAIAPGERILDIAATQLPSGGAYHQYQPLTKRGNDAVGSGFNDDPLWLVLAVAAYLKETGDVGILDEAVPYDNRPGSEEALDGHLRRSPSVRTHHDRPR